MDHTAELPQPILQHIMFFLPPDEAARACILSKSWWNAWASLPLLDFVLNEDVFTDIFLPTRSVREMNIQEEEEGQEFVQFVEDSLIALHKYKAIIKEFSLSLTLRDRKIASHINSWLRLVTWNCIKVLDLDLNRLDKKNSSWHNLTSSTQEISWLHLPCSTLASIAKSLTVLKLRGCKLEDAGLITNYTNFTSLKELSLVEVHIRQQIFNSLITCCLALEIFTLKHCHGLKELLISNSPKLQKVKLRQGNTELIQSINISAQLLQSLYYWGRNKKLEISMADFKWLKELTVVFAQIYDDMFENLVSELPLLENLSLHFCLRLLRVKISSHKLRKLSLRMPTTFLEAAIDTPNLISYEYGGSSLPSIFSIRAPGLEEVKLMLDPGNPIDTFWFVNLREYLGKFKHHNSLSLALNSDTVDVEFILEVVRHCLVQPVPVVKRMEIRSPGSEYSYGDLLDGLFWCCHPETLLLPNSAGSNSNLVKLLLKKMDQVPNCSNSSSIGCWRHYVKDIQVDSSFSYEHGIPFSGCERLTSGRLRETVFQFKWYD